MDTAERTAQIEAITLELTKCFSVCETAGEAQMGEKIYAMLAEIPYFRQHPEDLRRLPIEGDPWGRMSVLALLRGEKRPSNKTVVIIIYFTPPYYPHVCTDGMAGKGQKLLSAIEQAVAEEKSKYSIKLKKFFPCISDLSYSATSDNPAVLQAVAENTPAFGAIYGLPLEALSKLKIPVSMIGTYGYDAHKYTERLEKTYSFETMPNLLRRVINALLIEDDVNISSE